MFVQMQIPACEGIRNSTFVANKLISLIPCEQDLHSKVANCRERNISVVPNNLFEDTRDLDLAYNSITSLCNNSFRRYSNLLFLDLSANNIQVIEVATFDNLHALSELNLSRNSEISLRNFTSLSLHALTYISLYGCNVNFVAAEFLNKLPLLKKIVLSSNKLVNINITLCSSEELQEVYMDINQIREITSNTFILNCKYDFLNLGENPIQMIDPNAIALLPAKSLFLRRMAFDVNTWNNLLRGIVQSSVETLNLAFSNIGKLRHEFLNLVGNHFFSRLQLNGNKIRSISRQTFGNSSRIRELSLFYNEIKVIEPDYFTDMNELRILNLNNNLLEFINTGNATWSVDVREMYLRNNRLIVINSFAFHGLENLTVLDLSDNYDLLQLHLNSFTDLRGLQTLDLSYTSLESLSLHAPRLKSFSFHAATQSLVITGPIVPGRTFKNTKKLEIIKIEQSLTTDDLISKEDVLLFSGLKTLLFLDLSGNDFDLLYLPDGLLSEMYSLDKLYLFSCRISYLQSNLFNAMISLRWLPLHNNHIKEFPPVSNLHKLQHLYLNESKLIYLSEHAFLNMSSLTVIFLQGNFLTSLNHSTFDDLRARRLQVDL